MKQNLELTIMSLLSILFLTFHLTDDIRYGMAPARTSNVIAIAILVVWLYGTLALGERRWPYVIVLLASLLGSVVPVIHMRGSKGLLGGGVGTSSGAFFFVWTLLALGVTAVYSVILSVRGLWSLRGYSPGSPTTRT